MALVRAVADEEGPQRAWRSAASSLRRPSRCSSKSRSPAACALRSPPAGTRSGAEGSEAQAGVQGRLIPAAGNLLWVTMAHGASVGCAAAAAVAAVRRPPHSGRYRIPGGCGEEGAPRECPEPPAPAPPRRSCLCLAPGHQLPRGAHLGPRSDPDALRSPPSPRLQAAPFPQRALVRCRGETRARKLGPRSVAGVGRERRAPGTSAPLSPVALGVRDGERNPRQGVGWSGVGRGPEKPEGPSLGIPEPGISGFHPLCSISSSPAGNDPKEGNRKKLLGTSEPLQPPLHAAPPSYFRS